MVSKLKGGGGGGKRKGQLVREEEETKSEWKKLQSISQKTTLKCLPPKQRASVYGKIIVQAHTMPSGKCNQ